MLARLSLGTIALCLGAGAAIADPLADCSRGANAAVRLRACTAVIDGTAYGAEEKALAYRNRGNARADAGASMQAVSDFSQAIRLRPDDASGYAGRARARLALRDFDGAIADYGEATAVERAGADGIEAERRVEVGDGRFRVAFHVVRMPARRVVRR